MRAPFCIPIRCAAQVAAMAATCAAHLIGIQNGARILRVHDVAEAQDVISVNNAVVQSGSKRGHDE